MNQTILKMLWRTPLKKKKILSSIEKEKYKPRHAKGIVCTVSRSETNFIVIFVELTDIVGLW